MSSSRHSDCSKSWRERYQNYLKSLSPRQQDQHVRAAQPCEYPPGDPRKVIWLADRAAVQMAVLRFMPEGERKAAQRSTSLFRDGDAILPELLGYLGELIGGDKLFRTSLVKQVEDGVELVEDLTPHYGRHRTEEEKAAAKSEDARILEAARKRWERQERKRMKKRERNER